MVSIEIFKETLKRYQITEVITGWAIIGIIAFIIVIVTKRRKAEKIQLEKQKQLTETDIANTEYTTDNEFLEFKGKYQKRYLLTKNEYHEYKKLIYYANLKGLMVYPKVRLLDLIEPRRGDPKHKTLLYKIQSKHVDFVICDQNLYVKAILELDDNSHNQTDRQTRDNFVDLILQDVGYTVIRTRSITETTLDQIT